MVLRVITVALLIFSGCWPVLGDDPVGSGPSTSDFSLKTPFHTEEEYIVGSVCLNAYEMLSFIVDKKGDRISPDKVTVKKVNAGGTSYEVVVQANSGKIEVTLKWPGSIWSSQAYVPFCQAVMAKLNVKKAASNPSTRGNVLYTLLAFDEKSIESENSRVSRWLTAEPDNVVAHQQAALVLGTLAMKANSGWFWDPRDICNHLAAHLAVARALDPGADFVAEGQLAECLLGLIIDTKKDCSDEIDAMSKIASPPKELEIWLRACRVRNTRDWRLIDKPESATPLEQVEYLRAFGEAVSTEQASKWLRKNSIPPRQDWGRIIIQGGCSEEDGHTYALPSIGSEIKLMRTTFPDRFQRNTMIDDLNEPPGGVLAADGALHVITGGMWAQYFQRHICEDIVETGDFLENKWGVPDEAQLFYRSIINTFSSLSLFPYVEEGSPAIPNKLEDAKDLVAAFSLHPEWAPDWAYDLPDGAKIDAAGFHAMLQSWFSPAIPSGTAYCAAGRLEDVGTALTHQVAAVDALYAIGPLQYAVAVFELKAHANGEATYDQTLKVVGPMVDYYLPALDLTAKAKDVALGPRIGLEEKATIIDPDRFWELATDLKDHGREADAADAFQQYYEKGTNRVGVANSMEWLVNYYFDHDEGDKAMVIAKDCAEVYSYNGLLTMMHLQTRLQQYDEAEKYAADIKERYKDPTPLIAFYKERVDAGDAGYQAKLDAGVRDVFPSGLKKVTLASFSSSPSAGIRFSGTTPALRNVGITPDTVVVALDGYQVDDNQQYTLVRNFTKDPAMSFIVWDGTAYKQIKAYRPGRLFGVDIVPYSK